MKRNLISVMPTLIVIIFIGAAFTNIRNTNQKLQIKHIELQSNEAKLIELNNKYDKALEMKTKTQKEKDIQTQRIKELETDRERLQRDLQAKREKTRLDAERLNLASQKATGTQPVYAEGGNCQAIQNKLARLGVPSDQLASAGQLAMRESSCDEFVVNEIGACGAFQSLPCGKWGVTGSDDYYRNAINYVKKYGGYNGALAHSYSRNWY